METGQAVAVGCAITAADETLAEQLLTDPVCLSGCFPFIYFRLSSCLLMQHHTHSHTNQQLLAPAMTRLTCGGGFDGDWTSGACSCSLANPADHMSIGALGDSFYEYLLKEYIQSGGSDSTALRMYEEAMDGITSTLLQTSVQNHLMYFADMKYDRLDHKMDHLGCFSGGLLGLGSKHMSSESKRARHMEIAAGVTSTCHESYIRTPTHLGPESFRFTEGIEAKASRPNEKYYILRPEVIESYFVMWRLTKDQKYRDWAWDAVQAIEKHCRVEHGYTGLKNVYDENGVKDDVQQSFLFAELLKYLYLIFSSDDLIPLDQWVFNTEAHPLPVSGSNPAY